MCPVHPSQKRRAIDRKFTWKWGHDPNDDDATPSSPWRYLKIERYTPTDPDQRKLLTGGPDTGWDCLRCGNDTYHIAAARDWLWMLSQPEVEVVGDLPPAEELRKHEIVIWACPSCGHRIQYIKEKMPPFKDLERK